MKMQKMNLITWDDDNHAKRVFFNGHFVGTTADIGDMINNIIKYIDGFELSKIECKEVYSCDTFDDIDEEVYDNIFDFFEFADDLSERQIELINNEDWEELNKTI